jgi:hypothetical protein
MSVVTAGRSRKIAVGYQPFNTSSINFNNQRLSTCISPTTIRSIQATKLHRARACIMKGKEFDNSYRRKSYSVIQYLLIVICPALEPINIFKIYINI